MLEPIQPRQRNEADARAWFYLDHHQDIEAWAELRSEGRNLLHRHLLELGPMVNELAAREFADTYQGDVEDGDRPRFGLRRPEWAGTWLGEVAVVVEWQPSALLGLGRGDPWPFVAVRYDAALTDPARARRLDVALSALRKTHHGSTSRWWLFWRYVEPAAGPGIEPDALVRDCLLQLDGLWRAAATVLDGLHADGETAEPLL